jgi:TonB family protein
LPEDLIIRLWRDKPEFVALADAPPPAKRMRLISAVAPKYPYMLHFHVEATVVVSFVVGKDGRVEDARVVESSDSRFDSSAIDAILKFTWIPAEDSNGGPTREMAHMPFHFKPTLKPVNGSSGT